MLAVVVLAALAGGVPIRRVEEASAPASQVARRYRKQ